MKKQMSEQEYLDAERAKAAGAIQAKPADPMDNYEILEVTTNITGRGGNYMWHKDTHEFTRLEFGELLIEPNEKFGPVESILLPPGTWRADLKRKGT